MAVCGANVIQSRDRMYEYELLSFLNLRVTVDIAHGVIVSMFDDEFRPRVEALLKVRAPFILVF